MQEETRSVSPRKVLLLVLLLCFFAFLWRAPKPRLGKTLASPASIFASSNISGHPAVSGHHPSGLIRPRTFAYLVLGEHHPKAKWIERSSWPGVTVIFVTWKSEFNVTYLRTSRSVRRFHSYFFPRSTWTTARNKMVEYVEKVEAAQKWKFEFLLFFDEDVALMRDNQTECTKSPDSEECDNAALRALHPVLVDIRPARLSLAMLGYHTDDESPYDCMQLCQADHAFLAMHRSAVSLLLPYDNSLDKHNWWSSAHMANMYLDSLAPALCSHYIPIKVNMNLNIHGNYPKGNKGFVPSGHEFYAGRDRAQRRLESMGVKRKDKGILSTLYGAFVVPRKDVLKCNNLAAGVNYTQSVNSTVVERLKKLQEL